MFVIETDWMGFYAILRSSPSLVALDLKLRNKIIIKKDAETVHVGAHYKETSSGLIFRFY